MKDELKDELKNETKDEIKNVQIEGRNAVMEALRAEQGIDKIFFKKGEIEGSLKVILKMAKEAGVVTTETPMKKLDEISQTGKHQGVIALCPSYTYVDIYDILEKAEKLGEPPFIIILDEITDPHNLGAILRTADACGVHGVIIPKRRAASLTAVVSKTSAGAISYVPIARVTNLAATIERLKKRGLWVAAAYGGGMPMYEAYLAEPLAIVIGNEGTGVGRLIKERCDFNVAIPSLGKVESLNASVAAGVLMYETLRQRRFGIVN